MDLGVGIPLPIPSNGARTEGLSLLKSSENITTDLGVL